MSTGADRYLVDQLGNCGGYYSCPKDKDGKRLGPLVGYHGGYPGPDGKEIPYVGDVYANFAKAEPDACALNIFASDLAVKIFESAYLFEFDAFCMAPIGGYSLGTALGLQMGIYSIKAEKKVVALKTATSREKSELIFARHEIFPGNRYVIVEDVCNNFSTTEELIRLILSAGGKVTGITCFLNRSLTIDDKYYSEAIGDLIPVISLVRLPIMEYRQDDPFVAADVAAGNVVWKPKDEWPRLMKAMSYSCPM